MNWSRELGINSGMRRISVTFALGSLLIGLVALLGAERADALRADLARLGSLAPGAVTG